MVAVRFEQKVSETAEVVFQRLFVELDPGEAQKVIFEVVQIPGDRLPVEAAARVAHVVVQVAAGFDLKQGQYPNRFKVGVHHVGADAVSGAVRLEELVKCGVAEVFFEVHAPVEVFGVNRRDGQSVTAKVSGEFQERRVLAVNAVHDADGARDVVTETEDSSTRTAELSLQCIDAIGR